MLEIRNCTKLPGQQGVYATADIAAGKLFVAYGRSLPVRFNARRHAQGKQVKINETLAYDLTMSDRFIYKLNCAGGDLSPFPNCAFVASDGFLAVRVSERVAAGQQLLLSYYF